MISMYWIILWAIAVVILLAFSFVIIFGAPYLPTLKKQVPLALDLIDLKPGQTLLELGSGDGRVLIEGAKRGLYVVGYELNPILVIYSWLRTRRYRKNISIVWGNYWKIEWPPTDGIFVFLLQPYMEKLDKKIVQYNHRPVKLVSFAFNIEGRKPTRKRGGLLLYTYR